jgi:hypothetical protein
MNLERARCVLLSRHRNAGQDHDIVMANRCFENVARFGCLAMTITNLKLIQEEIKRRLNLGSACCQSVQKLLSSCLLSRGVKVRVCKAIVLPVVLCGCEAWVWHWGGAWTGGFWEQGAGENVWNEDG